MRRKKIAPRELNRNRGNGVGRSRVDKRISRGQEARAVEVGEGIVWIESSEGFCSDESLFELTSCSRS